MQCNYVFCSVLIISQIVASNKELIIVSTVSLYMWVWSTNTWPTTKITGKPNSSFNSEWIQSNFIDPVKLHKNLKNCTKTHLRQCRICRICPPPDLLKGSVTWIFNIFSRQTFNQKPYFLLRKCAKLTYSNVEFQNFPGEDPRTPRFKGRGGACATGRSPPPLFSPPKPENQTPPMIERNI